MSLNKCGFPLSPNGFCFFFFHFTKCMRNDGALFSGVYGPHLKVGPIIFITKNPLKIFIFLLKKSPL